MKKHLLRNTFIAATLLIGSFSASARAEMEDTSIAVLRTVDKVSARTHTFDIPVDKTVKFGASLFIKARACRKSSPLDKPESAAFLQIWERKPHEEEAHWIFSGWMFASNPSVSVMEHPVYDVWVIACKNNLTTVKSDTFSSETAPVAKPEETPVSATDVESVAPAETTPATEPVVATETPVTPEVKKSLSEQLPAEIMPDRPASPPPPLEEMPSSFEDEGAAVNTGD